MNNLVSSSPTEHIYKPGQPCFEGVWKDVPIETYHSDPALFDGAFSISSSGLKKFINRPSEYWAYSPFNPDREEDVVKKELEFGKAAHMLLLGEAGFSSKYVRRPSQIDDKPWQGNRSVCKDWLAEQAKAGLIVITDEDIVKIQRMSEALDKHPLVKLGLLNGKVERSLFLKTKVDKGSFVKTDEFFIRCRPDVMPIGSGDFVDVKTAADVSYEFLSRTVGNMGYHIQAAIVRWLVTSILGDQAYNSFTLVFVEKGPPYDIRVMELKESDIDLGYEQIQSVMPTLNKCLETGEWPGYDGFDRSPQWLEMPSWASTRIKNEIEMRKRTS